MKRILKWIKGFCGPSKKELLERAGLYERRFMVVRADCLKIQARLEKEERNAENYKRLYEEMFDSMRETEAELSKAMMQMGGLRGCISSQSRRISELNEAMKERKPKYGKGDFQWAIKHSKDGTVVCHDGVPHFWRANSLWKVDQYSTIDASDKKYAKGWNTLYGRD